MEGMVDDDEETDDALSGAECDTIVRRKMPLRTVGVPGEVKSKMEVQYLSKCVLGWIIPKFFLVVTRTLHALEIIPSH